MHTSPIAPSARNPSSSSAALDRLDEAGPDEAQERQDAMAAQRLVQDALFGSMD